MLTIYTTDNCAGCALTKKMLEKEGVAFEAVSLADRPDLVDQFRAEGLMSAPIIDHDGQRTSGFRPDRIKAIIAASAPTNAVDANAGTAVPTRTPTHGDGFAQGIRL